MNFFKSFIFSEASPLIRLAKSKNIEESDLLALPEDVDPRCIGIPQEEIRWTTPSALLFSLFKSLRRYLARAFGFYMIFALASLATPLLVNKFVKLISVGVTNQSLPMAIAYGIALGFCGFAAGLSLQHYFYRILRANQISTNVLNQKIFRHSLTLSQHARQKNQLGDIVNYMSSDSDSIADFPSVVIDFFFSFFLMTGVICMLFYFIGWSALAALLVLFTLAPLTKYVARKFTKLDEEMMAFRDHRVNLMTQALNAIRVVKYFAWEKSVSSEVTEIREKELSSRRKLAKSETVASLGYLGVSTLVLFVALAVHAMRGQTMDAAIIFTCISLFALLEGPFGDLSHLISRATAARVGARRILTFLTQEQVAVSELKVDATEDQVGLSVHGLTMSYPEASAPILKEIDFDVLPGKSVAIVGPVGSGKSSLLQALLGEFKLSAGLYEYVNTMGAEVRPRVAYVPQEAYIINGTLLENLQFGEVITKEETRRSLHNSCLAQDIRQWKGGLRTEIGEKGVNLSGGQKQRVALARACLSKPQVVLLDDPLSAVDADTESQLCDRLLFGAWKDITRIVVTHRLEHLSRFDRVIFLDKGEIRAQGKFAQLNETSTEFAAFYSEHRKSQGEGAAVAASVVPAEAVNTADEENAHLRVTEDEEKEVGAVKKSVYWDYVSSLGGDGSWRFPILMLLGLGSASIALLPLSQKAWLSYYANHQSEWVALSAIGIYGLIGIFVLIGNLSNQIFWLNRGIRSAQNMHSRMLQSVLHAPIRFFDSTPVGRILQRFSRDIESVDVYLQWSFSAAVNCALQVIVSLVLILSLMPAMVLIIGPLMILYYSVQRDYRKPAREAKRFDSIGRSPRYAHFKESLQGLVVIRSFNKSEWFTKNFYDKLAHSQRMFYSHYMLNRWFSSRIPLIGGLISTSTSVGVALSAFYGLMDAGTAGLVTLYSLSFWGFLNWGIRIFADIESRMTSVERLKFFANLESEKSILKPAEVELRETWPERGKIEVEDLQVRYAKHLPMVLKGISFTVSPGSRVGIVGRTGSGKSTFFQSLFRFVEADQGIIRIDGVDIASIPLDKLRENLAIIPQDPTLFMGTIRNNLDRYGRHTEEQINTALKHSSMFTFVSNLPMGLNSPVTESGLNLSQGQRQLLCLARALLNRAKVIVMDEATASVDVQTDVLLQRVIREAFAGVTMLIIAHRLGTISDCDQIIEIAEGQVKSVRRPTEWNKKEIEDTLV